MLKTRKKGLTCEWERGGNGFATIFCNAGGYAVSHYKILMEKNNRHALVRVNPGYLNLVYHDGIIDIFRYNVSLGKEMVFSSTTGVWWIKRPKAIDRALQAVVAKALDKECIKPYYTKEIAQENDSRLMNRWTF